MLSRPLYLIYKIVFGPLMRALSGPGFESCRYVPSCSDYAREAFATHNAFYAFYLSALRVLRCHPWSKHNPWDPVPTVKIPNLCSNSPGETR